MNRPIALLLTLALGLALGLTGCASGGGQTGTTEAAGRSTVDSLYPFTLMRQGSAMLQQARYPDALAKFQEASRLQPGNATTHNMIGLCYLKMEQYDKAVAAFSQALDLVPSFTDARNNRGAAYLALQQYRMAELDFMAVLSDTTYPHRWEVFYNLGMTYMQRGDLLAAEENFRRAADSPSPVYQAFLRLADIAEQQGHPDAAISRMEQAHFAFPDKLEATLRLGRLLMQNGRTEEARPYLEQVISADPGSSAADEAQQLLTGK